MATKTYCGSYIESSFYATRQCTDRIFATSSAEGIQCDSCKLIDAENTIVELENKLDNLKEKLDDITTHVLSGGSALQVLQVIARD